MPKSKEHFLFKILLKRKEVKFVKNKIKEHCGVNAKLKIYIFFSSLTNDLIQKQIK